MKIFVINCGSSSLKYQVLEMPEGRLLCKGLVERIGMDGPVINHTKEGCEKVTKHAPMSTHKEALGEVLAALVNKDYGVIKDMSEIGAVGHRITHGGEKFADSVLLTDEVVKAIEDMIPLAPLHNPPQLLGIEACRQLMPSVPAAAVFDTAFHQTMPKESYIYALPYEYYEKYGVRRYGFHGTSHKYVSERAAAILGENIESLKLITCHLGNGASVAAVDGGKAVDTSMGFTPLEGLAMGTRSGDIDPAIISFVAKREGLSLEEFDAVLNKKSGVFGISGISSDFRDLEAAAGEGNERAELAIKVFAHKVRFYIGAYMAEMNGADAIIFTAGIGENDISMRKMICGGLENLGIKLDDKANNVRGKETVISAPDSKIKILLIPTNEELMIAKDTYHLVTGEK